MSELSRELYRQVLYIERQTRDLAQSVEDLMSVYQALASGTDGWDEVQAEAIRTAIYDHADDCGRYISQAQTEVDGFRQELAGSGR